MIENVAGVVPLAGGATANHGLSGAAVTVICAPLLKTWKVCAAVADPPACPLKFKEELLKRSAFCARSSLAEAKTKKTVKMAQE